MRLGRSNSGAGDGSRTRDLLLGRQPLCQLSYPRSRARLHLRALAAQTSTSILPPLPGYHPATPSERVHRYEVVKFLGEGGRKKAYLDAATALFQRHGARLYLDQALEQRALLKA